MTPLLTEARLQEMLTQAGTGPEGDAIRELVATWREARDIEEADFARMTRIREMHYHETDQGYCATLASGIAEDLAWMLLCAMRDAPNYREILVEGTDAEIKGAIGQALRFSVTYLRPGAKSPGMKHREARAEVERLTAENARLRAILAADGVAP